MPCNMWNNAESSKQIHLNTIFKWSFSDIMYFCRTFFLCFGWKGVSEEGLMEQGSIMR